MVETLGVGKGAATLEDMESTELIFIFGTIRAQTIRAC